LFKYKNCVSGSRLCHVVRVNLKMRSKSGLDSVTPSVIGAWFMRKKVCVCIKMLVGGFCPAVTWCLHAFDHAWRLYKPDHATPILLKVWQSTWKNPIGFMVKKKMRVFSHFWAHKMHVKMLIWLAQSQCYGIGRKKLIWGCQGSLLKECFHQLFALTIRYQWQM
jgi:hypothetical protein